MPSKRRITILRILERVVLAVFLISSLGAMWFFFTLPITSYELVAVVGVVALLLAVLVYLQTKVDQWIIVTLEQTNFVQDDVFSSLYDRSPVAYVTINKQGIISEYNSAAAKLLQTEITTLQGKNFFDLLHADSTFDVSVLQGKIAAGLTITDIETPLVKANAADAVWALLSVFAYRSSDMRLVSLVDVTEQKKIDTAKSEFVALATHQLRTPIAAIRWNVELLQKNLKAQMTEPQERYLTKIQRNVLRMIALINDFLSVSKLEMGTYATNKEATVLSDFVTAILDEFSGKITEKQIVVTRDTAADVTIMTDYRLLHIIVSNLVSNAVKYLHQQGTLFISYQVQGNEMVLTIKDNGIGIPQNELEHLFTKFYRASNAQSHQTEGTGLGLYIVKQSVEQLGGGITVDSDIDKGAEFVVTLPIQ